MSTGSTTHSYPELVTEASGWLVGGGILTVAVFPLAVPLVALTALAVMPFVLVPIAVGLVTAVVAAPILLVRAVGRRVFRALAARRRPQSGHPDSAGGRPALSQSGCD
jgi:hypothetical protein